MDAYRLSRKLGAEFIGTLALVLVGCGAIVSDAQSGGQLGHVGICLAFGLVIVVMVSATGHISGAHFNPAVTVAFAIDGRFPWGEVVPYVVSQIAGALCASWLILGLLGDHRHLGATVTELTAIRAVGIEVCLTAILMFVISAVATDSRAHGQMASIAIGGTVAAAALVGGPFTGASMNPARSLGPALVSGQLGGLWIYLFAPLVGAALGILAYRLVRCEVEASDQEVKGGC